MEVFHVEWTVEAEKDLQTVYYFVRQNSEETATKIIEELVRISRTLTTFPFRNPVEPLLNKSNIEFRFLVKWNYKIVYFVEHQTVFIIRVFDTRQNPEKLSV